MANAEKNRKEAEVGQKQEAPAIAASSSSDSAASDARAVERRHRFGFSLVWVVPLLAVILTGWLIWTHSINKGPEITLITASADGIEPGKTMVRFRSVNVGMVTAVRLSDDYKSTIMTVQMNPKTENMLRSDTLFWIVKPRFEHTGITGLDTLLSGPYLEMQLGSSNSMATEFEIISKPPVHFNPDKGIVLNLLSSDSKRISDGEVVTFRGFDVGYIVDSMFDMEKKQIMYKVFIKSPYDAMVNHHTRFWISSGIDFQIDQSGISFNTDSLNNIISGGISFNNFYYSNEQEISAEAVPAYADADGDDAIADNAEFVLYANKDLAKMSMLSDGLRYVVMTDTSANRITVGTDITFNGVKIGEVITAPWISSFREVLDSGVLPVLFAIQTFDIERSEMESIIDSYMSKGMLCARITSSNPILGSSKIDLFIDREAKCTTGALSKSYPSSEVKRGIMFYRNQKVIPLIPGTSIQDQVDAALANINRFDMQGFSDELKNSLKSFSEAMQAFARSNDALKNTEAIKKLAQAFDNFNKAVKSYGPDTEVYKSMKQSLNRIEQLLQDVSPALREVGQNPNSILFGGQDDLLPAPADQKNKSGE